MRSLITIVLLLGAVLLPASKGFRDAVIHGLTVIASGVERLVLRGDYAEIRMVDGGNFDGVIREPGRLVIVVVQNELTASSRNSGLNLDRAMKELPSKVIIAKVTAERDAELMTRLKITDVPAIRVYREGVLLRRVDGTPDEKEFLAYIRARLQDKATAGGPPDIRPMEDDWLPPGVEAQ